MNKLKQIGLVALLAGAVSFSAAAEEAVACPNNAAQAMYQVSEALPGATTMEQISNGYNYTASYAAACPEDAYTQYFVALSFYRLAEKIADPGQQFQLMSAAIAALHIYDAAWENLNPDLIWTMPVKPENGPDIRVFTGTRSTSLLESKLVPMVVVFEAGGLFHDMISGKGQTEESPCPWHRPEMAIAEARGHVIGQDTFVQYYSSGDQLPNIMGSADRLKFLAAACPNVRKQIVFESATLYAHAAKTAYDFNIDDSAADYAADAITQYELFRSLANDTAADRSKLTLVDNALKRMREMAPETAE
nr:hypothetical protein [uncultured Hyphomonas sp.]